MPGTQARCIENIMYCSYVHISNQSCVQSVNFSGCRFPSVKMYDRFCRYDIARFPFVDWAELIKACHSISKPRSPHEKNR